MVRAYAFRLEQWRALRRFGGDFEPSGEDPGSKVGGLQHLGRIDK